ncbi:helix-turn-helix domain-containing protein, partial [Apibacter adventoris]
MSVKERIKKFVSYKNISIRNFCNIIGVSSAYITSMRKSIQPDKLESISLHFPDINIEWLLTGEGSMLKYHVKDIIDRLKKYLNFTQDMQLTEYLRISIETLYIWKESNSFDKDLIKEKLPNIDINWLLTGKGNEPVNKEKSTGSLNLTTISGYYFPDVSASAGLNMKLENAENQKIPISIPGWGSDLIFINVYGDSMYPKYNSGEIIAIKNIEFQYINYGFPYVVVFKNGDTYIKYIDKGKDHDHILLISENKHYAPKE